AAQGVGDSCGEQLYHSSGIGGVRAEAAAAVPSVREAALPRLRACLAAGMGVQDAALCALVALMARAEDTNAVRRGGAEGARKLRERAKAEDAALCMRLAQTEFDAQKEGETLRQRMAQWDAELSAAGISPGGCADMLALTLMVTFMEEKPA
ncbi:MAG: triphosphoribosyl-dephospho-CoA synthase, partial [Candidatus Spyradocola sp.]